MRCGECDKGIEPVGVRMVRHQIITRLAGIGLNAVFPEARLPAQNRTGQPERAGSLGHPRRFPVRTLAQSVIDAENAQPVAVFEWRLNPVIKPVMVLTVPL